MLFENRKLIIAAVWVLALCAVGFGLGARSISAWIVLVCLAGVPGIVMLRWWSDPAPSMSESINQGRR